MVFRLQDNISGIIYALVGVAIFAIRTVSRAAKLNAIPTVGSSSWLGSWLAGFTFLKNAENVVQEGYDKYKSAPFKVAETFQWRVIVSDRAHLEELTKASDDDFSSWKPMEDQLQVNHTFGPESKHIPRYIPFVGACVSRNIEAMCPEIEDEITTSFPKVLDLAENEWKSVLALDIVEEMVCRTSNRVFVGLPLCRNPEWINLSKQSTEDLIKGGYIIGLFPEFMRPLAVQYFTKIPQNIASCVKLLGPIIEERRKYLNKGRTEWNDKPNDLLSWLMEDAKGPEELTTKRLIVPLLLAGIASLYTITHSFTQALLRLAVDPQYIQPLREEVEGVVGKHGWSKVALGKMRKVDSFFKECQRIQGINTGNYFNFFFGKDTLTNRVISDHRTKGFERFYVLGRHFYTKGTTVSAACQPIHRDEKFHESPDVFKPFRFIDVHGDKEDSDGPNRHFVTTTLEHLPFGHGRHACPGRFLAGCIMKMMLAYVVVTYDVKLEGDAKMLPGVPFGILTKANPRAKVMFRKRVD